jgi:hypothetical protein
MAGEGRWRRSLSRGTEENHEIRNQVSQSTGSDANMAPPVYEEVVPTADLCSVLRRKFSSVATVFITCGQKSEIVCVHAALTST